MRLENSFKSSWRNTW